MAGLVERRALLRAEPKEWPRRTTFLGMEVAAADVMTPFLERMLFDWTLLIEPELIKPVSYLRIWT